jgi:galactose oxidase-like protein
VPLLLFNSLQAAPLGRGGFDGKARFPPVVEWSRERRHFAVESTRHKEDEVKVLSLSLSFSLLAGAAALVPDAEAQTPGRDGQWLGPWNYPSMFGAIPHQGEIAHFDLQVTGPYQGQVLLWRATLAAVDPAWLLNWKTPQNLSQFSGPTTSNACVPAGPSTNIFCSGHVKMVSGQTLIAGGSVNAPGPPGLASSFLHEDKTWFPAGCMTVPRWYPTVIRLADDRAIGFGGQQDGSVFWQNFEIYDPAAPIPWTAGPSCPPWPACYNSTVGPLGLYPRVFLLSSGKIFVCGEFPCASLLDLSSAPPTWTEKPPSETTGFVGRSDGCAFMMPDFHSPGPDNAVILGGGNFTFGGPTKNTIQVNPNPEGTDPSPWKSVNDDPTFTLSFARAYANPVILPDGSVVIIGGSSVVYDGGLNWTAGIPPFTPPSQFPSPVLVPELLYRDAGTGPWLKRNLASHTFARLYHSVAILLPTGQVLSGGGTQADWITLATQIPSLAGVTNSDIAIYNPPYLYQGARPVIAASPGAITYGAPFTLTLLPNDDEDVTPGKVVLIRPGSVTHHFDFEQKYVPCNFTVTGPNSLSVTAPSNPNVAPRGDWMLFLVSTSGIPSEAVFVHLQ